MIRCLSLLALLGLHIASCTTYVKIPAVTQTPQGFTGAMRGGRNIVILRVPYQEPYISGLASNWSASVLGAVEKAINDYAYFRIIDPGSRRMRLEALAQSQTGLTSTQKQLGQELAIDGFLIVEIAGSPAYDCKQKISFETRNECLQRNSEGKCMSSRDVREKIITGEMHFAMPLKARLVNVETGQALAHQHDRPSVTANYRGNEACPAITRSFESALSASAGAIVSRLSPRVTLFSVPLLKDGPDGPSEDATEEALKAGIKWAKTDPPQMEEAQKHWQEALRVSNYKSASAFWNLAVIAWAQGDMDGAEQNFRRAQGLGGQSFLSSGMQKAFSLFAAEKKRMSMEGN
jgi:hypothetical protein